MPPLLSAASRLAAAAFRSVRGPLASTAVRGRASMVSARLSTAIVRRAGPFGRRPLTSRVKEGGDGRGGVNGAAAAKHLAAEEGGAAHAQEGRPSMEDHDVGGGHHAWPLDRAAAPLGAGDEGALGGGEAGAAQEGGLDGVRPAAAASGEMAMEEGEDEDEGKEGSEVTSGDVSIGDELDGGGSQGETITKERSRSKCTQPEAEAWGEDEKRSYMMGAIGFQAADLGGKGGHDLTSQMSPDGKRCIIERPNRGTGNSNVLCPDGHGLKQRHRSRFVVLVEEDLERLRKAIRSAEAGNHSDDEIMLSSVRIECNWPGCCHVGWEMPGPVAVKCGPHGHGTNRFLLRMAQVSAKFADGSPNVNADAQKNVISKQSKHALVRHEKHQSADGLRVLVRLAKEAAVASYGSEHPNSASAIKDLEMLLSGDGDGGEVSISKRFFDPSTDGPNEGESRAYKKKRVRDNLNHRLLEHAKESHDVHKIGSQDLPQPREGDEDQRRSAYTEDELRKSMDDGLVAVVERMESNHQAAVAQQEKDMAAGLVERLESDVQAAYVCFAGHGTGVRVDPDVPGLVKPLLPSLLVSDSEVGRIISMSMFDRMCVFAGNVRGLEQGTAAYDLGSGSIDEDGKAASFKVVAMRGVSKEFQLKHLGREGKHEKWEHFVHAKLGIWIQQLTPNADRGAAPASSTTFTNAEVYAAGKLKELLIEGGFTIVSNNDDGLWPPTLKADEKPKKYAMIKGGGTGNSCMQQRQCDKAHDDYASSKLWKYQGLSSYESDLYDAKGTLGSISVITFPQDFLERTGSLACRMVCRTSREVTITGKEQIDRLKRRQDVVVARGDEPSKRLGGMPCFLPDEIPSRALRVSKSEASSSAYSTSELEDVLESLERERMQVQTLIKTGSDRENVLQEALKTNRELTEENAALRKADGNGLRTP